MRLGGPTFGDKREPGPWIAELQALGYTAAYCPVGTEAPDREVQAFAAASASAGIVIAEVGAWSNPISRDARERSTALDRCKKSLALAERIGARCCVNITGSRGPKWDGPCAEDLTPATFDLVVASVQEIVDAVKPARTFYTLETMPWMYPDSAASYKALLAAIDRPGCAVHFDPVNLVNCAATYFGTADMIRRFAAILGPQIRSCHAKDIILGQNLTTHLDECRPGTGGLDYAVFLREIERLDPDMPVMLEHLKTEDEYRLAADHIRAIAAQEGIVIKEN